MKRLIALLLCLAVVCAPTASFAVQAQESEDLAALCAAERSEFDARLFSSVRRALATETVTAVYQSAVLCAEEATRLGARGVPLPVGSECELAFGDEVTVGRSDCVLKIFNVAVVEETRDSDEEGAEPLTYETCRRFEIKSIYLEAGSVFSVHRTEAGLRLHLARGSLSYTYTKDAFSEGEFTLSTDEMRLAAGENYLVFGKNDAGTLVYHLGGRSDVLATLASGTRTVRAQSGFFAASQGGGEPAAFPLAAEYGALPYSSCAFSLFEAMLQNSALAALCSEALAREGAGLDVNTVREAWLEEILALRREEARSYEAAAAEYLRLPVTAEDFSAGDLSAPLSRTLSDTQWIVRYPASCAAYSVRGALESVNVAALSAESELVIAVTLSVPLSAVGDNLYLTLGETRFDINYTEGVSTYLFHVPVQTLKEIYAADGAAKSFSVVYRTAATHLFFETDTPAYSYVGTSSLTDLAPGEPVSLAVRLKDALSEGDEFCLVLSTERGEERISPTLLSAEDHTYLFTVTPQAGANFAELDIRNLCEVKLDDALSPSYSVTLSGTDGRGLVASGSSPCLFVLPGDESEYVPVVLQTSGGESRALTPDAFGRYILSPVQADTTLSLSPGYPVTLSQTSELYTLEPLPGYSAEYAEAMGEYRFKVHLSKSAALGTSLLVKNNGVTLTPDSEGVYIIASVTQPVRLSITHGVTYNVFLPAGDAFTVSPYGGDGTTVLENGTFRFTLQLSQTAAISQLIVAANESVITPDAAGVYTVSGITRDVYVTVRLLSSFRVILPSGDGYIAAPYGDSDSTVLSGGSFSFTLQTDESVREESALAVYANETLLEKNAEGVYVIENVQSDVYVTVHLSRAFLVEASSNDALYTVTLPEKSVLYGASYSFSVVPKKAVSLTVYINGRAVQGVSGTYTVEHVYSDLYISVFAAEDASEETHRVRLFSSDGISAQVLSSVDVKEGEDFLFSVTLAGSHAQSAVRIKASVGTPRLKERTEEGGKTTFLYAVSGIDADCQITVERGDGV